MSKILFCWEGGANLGHVDRMLGIADILHSRGHTVIFALRDISRTYTRVVSHGYRVLQAPVINPRTVPRIVNFAGILATVGWLDPEGLAGLVSGWRELFKLIEPDLLIADHSPTALLAWRGHSKPATTLGSSFEDPPHGEHFPAFRWWERQDRDADLRNDLEVLETANHALRLLGDAPLTKLTDIFDVSEHFLLTLPELAHYHDYPANTRFWGPSYRGNAGTDPVWPSGDGPRVFAYLESAHKDFSSLMETLRKLEWPTIVYSHGISDEDVRRLQSHALSFSSTPLKMNAVVTQASVVISHASLGTATAAMLAGKPQLLLPNHIEQYMVARRIDEVGAGIFSVPGERRLDYKSALRRLVTEPSFAVAAQTIAARHAGESPEMTDLRVADRCEELLKN